MTERTCPVNARPCRCDAAAADTKLHPCMLVKRIGKLIRLLGSDYDGEMMSAVQALKRFCATENVSLNDIALLVEGCNGKIEERRYSESDAEMIFAKGMERGRTEQQDTKLEFFDIDGQPRWYDITLFNRNNVGQLRNDWEIEFTNDIVGKMFAGRPSPKQAKHILKIFLKLGGHCDPAIQATYLFA
jgi:hypothetical protein